MRYVDDYAITGRSRRKVLDLRNPHQRNVQTILTPDLFAVKGIAGMVVTHYKGNLRKNRDSLVTIAEGAVTFSGTGTLYLVAEYIWNTGQLSVAASTVESAPDATTYRKILHEFESDDGSTIRHIVQYHTGTIEVYR